MNEIEIDNYMQKQRALVQAENEWIENKMLEMQAFQKLNERKV